MAALYYKKELKHVGLNKYRVVKAGSQYELEEKCIAIANQWNEQWKRKCETAQKRFENEEGTNEANRLTAQAEQFQITLSNILIHNINANIDTSINSFIRKDIFIIPKPKEPILKIIPVEPERIDHKYNPTIGFFSKIFGGEQRSKLENDAKYKNDYDNWSKIKANLAKENETVSNLYNQTLQEWNTSKEIFERNKVESNEEIQKFWSSLQSADTESMHRFFTDVISRIVIPIEYENDFEFDYISDSKMAILDFCLPVITDIPSLKKVSFVKTQKLLKEFYHTEAYMKKLYDQVIYQIILSLLNVIFRADEQFSFIESIVINGQVNTVDKSTGQSISPCILSVSIKKENFLNLNLVQIDSKEWFKSNKGVSASTFSTVTPVMPIIQLSKEDNRFVQGYEIVNEIDNSTNLAAMDWQDFENLIRELFEKEFNHNGGEVKITQASRDGGVDAVAFDPDPIRGGKIVIQAKRYTNVVGVSAVRDLYGTVMNEGATKGILVSTANYGSDAYDFAKNKPLTLLNGANLLALLEKHGHKAKIDLKAAKEYFASINC